MKINQIAYMPVRLYSSNKNTTTKAIKTTLTIKVSFKGKKPLELPTTPQTTIDWALNWDKDTRKRKKRLDWPKLLKFLMVAVLMD